MSRLRSYIEVLTAGRSGGVSKRWLIWRNLLGERHGGAKRPEREAGIMANGRKAGLPPNTVVYAVGDVHGCATLLDELHKKIELDARSNTAEAKYIVYLGDYIDRGPGSKGVIDRLLDAIPSGLTPVYLMGNHDETLLRFLEDSSVYQGWRDYGAPQTLLSYGVRPPLFHRPELVEEARFDLIEAMPSRHVAFFKSLQLSQVLGDYVFVHAGMRPNIPLADQTDRDLLWIREDFLSATEPFEQIVVHGHTPVPRPQQVRHRISVDTGAYATGTLTCAVLEGETCRFLSASGPGKGDPRIMVKTSLSVPESGSRIHP